MVQRHPEWLGRSGAMAFRPLVDGGPADAAVGREGLGGHAAGKEPSPESRANIEARSKNASAKPQARGRVPVNQGIWVGICCEYVEFLVLFTVYFVARAHFPESSLHGFVAIVPLPPAPALCVLPA